MPKKADENETLYDRYIARVKNHKMISLLLVAGVGLGAMATLTDQASKVTTALSSWFGPNAPRPVFQGEPFPQAERDLDLLKQDALALRLVGTDMTVQSVKAVFPFEHPARGNFNVVAYPPNYTLQCLAPLLELQDLLNRLPLPKKRGNPRNPFYCNDSIPVILETDYVAKGTARIDRSLYRFDFFHEAFDEDSRYKLRPELLRINFVRHLGAFERPETVVEKEFQERSFNYHNVGEDVTPLKKKK